MHAPDDKETHDTVASPKTFIDGPVKVEHQKHPHRKEREGSMHLALDAFDTAQSRFELLPSHLGPTSGP